MGIYWTVAFHIVRPIPTFLSRLVFGCLWVAMFRKVGLGCTTWKATVQRNPMVMRGSSRERQSPIFFGKSMSWSSIDFLLQLNREKSREIVSMTYYPKAYVNIRERLKINNTDVASKPHILNKRSNFNCFWYRWNCLPVDEGQYCIECIQLV